MSSNGPSDEVGGGKNSVRPMGFNKVPHPQFFSSPSFSLSFSTTFSTYRVNPLFTSSPRLPLKFSFELRFPTSLAWMNINDPREYIQLFHLLFISPLFVISICIDHPSLLFSKRASHTFLPLINLLPTLYLFYHFIYRFTIFFFNFLLSFFISIFP